jgi:hypothetical protein
MLFMIDENIRAAVRTLFNNGKAKKEIARIVGIDIKTVRSILQKEDDKPKIRSDKIIIDEDLLQTTYSSCNGYLERVYEKLTEEHGIDIGYSTLTRRIRDLEIGKSPKRRSGHYEDVPGEEMQHDTSPYTIPIDKHKKKVVCSSLYLRYCKLRYIKFYPVFNRFTMKCFLYEALQFFGYCADTCIIDNTNLAVLYGTGENAVFNPEMIQFANQFGFRWKAHRVRHSDRKAGVERTFHTVETSFFPGRAFSSFEDLNSQAKQWATVRYANRPQSKTKLIPNELFEYEKPFLHPVDPAIIPPYRELHRLIDAYGYIAFAGNYYWIPESIKGRNIKILEYEKKLEAYQKHSKLIEYPLPSYGVNNKRFSPPGIKTEPNNRKKGAAEEESVLRAKGSICCSYLDFVHSGECRCHKKSKLIRDLYSLSKKLSENIFTKALQRALEYKVDSIRSIERIAMNLLQKDLFNENDIQISCDYQSRTEYQKGRFSNEADLQSFQELIDGNEGKDE